MRAVGKLYIFSSFLVALVQMWNRWIVGFHQDFIFAKCIYQMKEKRDKGLAVYKGVILVIVESESGQMESECGVCFGSGGVMRSEKLTRATTGTLAVASLEYCVVQRSLR